MRRFFTKGRVALLAIAVTLLFLSLYRTPTTGGVSVQSVGAGLTALGYEHCGTYTLGPGDGAVTFSKAFEDAVMCFIIVKRPGESYMFKEPRANLIIEPPSEKTVYKYSVGVRFFQSINVLSSDESIRPFNQWGAGVLNRTAGSLPVNELNAANEDLYVAFSYKPEKNGFPVNITLIVRADVAEGRAPPQPSLLETGIHRLGEVIGMVVRGELAGVEQLGPDPRKQKLAAQVGIKDIKVFMAYLGYELCGEFTARETDEIQKVELEVEIDLNEGKACYILIHPPPGSNAFLIISSLQEIELVGDKGHIRQYLRKFTDEIDGQYHIRDQYLLATPFELRSAYEVLGLGRLYSEKDVERPYTSRIGGSVNMAGGGHTEFIDNTPILIYFAYKGDPEVLKTFNERLQLWLRTYTVVEFRIIQARYVVSVD